MRCAERIRQLGTIDLGGRSVITGHGCTAVSCLCGLYQIAYMPAWSAGLLGRVDEFSSLWLVLLHWVVQGTFKLTIAKRMSTISIFKVVIAYITIHSGSISY